MQKIGELWLGCSGGVSPCVGPSLAGREPSLEEKRADHVVGGMNDALGFTLLGGIVGAGHTHES